MAGGTEGAAVLVQGVGVGYQIGYRSVGRQQQALRQLESVERLAFPPLPTVPQHSLDRHFPSVPTPARVKYPVRGDDYVRRATR